MRCRACSVRDSNCVWIDTFSSNVALEAAQRPSCENMYGEALMQLTSLPAEMLFLVQSMARRNMKPLSA